MHNGAGNFFEQALSIIERKTLERYIFYPDIGKSSHANKGLFPVPRG
jgi:hypothetical protein